MAVWASDLLGNIFPRIFYFHRISFFVARRIFLNVFSTIIQRWNPILDGRCWKSCVEFNAIPRYTWFSLSNMRNEFSSPSMDDFLSVGLWLWSTQMMGMNYATLYLLIKERPSVKTFWNIITENRCETFYYEPFCWIILSKCAWFGKKWAPILTHYSRKTSKQKRAEQIFPGASTYFCYS